MSCHGGILKTYKKTSHSQVGISCIDCHMPRITKSAVKYSDTEGDVRTHIFKINTDPKAKMFTKDGKFAVGGYITMDFSCLNCHKNKDLEWAGKKAKGYHKKK